MSLPSGSAGEESTCSAGDTGDLGSIPGSGRSPGGGHGNPLQYACLETPMGRGAWRATVRRVAESDTTEATECACTHTRTHTHTHNYSSGTSSVFTVVQATPASISGTVSSSRAETLYLINDSRLPSPQPPFYCLSLSLTPFYCLSLSLTDLGTACK